jgi:methyl-accepting chemotaxis protein
VGIIAALTAIIDVESTLPATPARKALLKILADSRGSFALGLANIRAFILTGDRNFETEFLARWATNEARFKLLSEEPNNSLFTSEQAQAWQSYKTLRGEFALLPATLFDLRNGKDWNLANYWLGSKAAPKAAAMTNMLEELRASQDLQAAQDKAELNDELSAMKMTMLIGTVIALAFGVFIAIWVSNMISTPLSKVVSRAKAIGSGDLSGQLLPVNGNDELTDLTQSINVMSGNLSHIVSKILGSSEQLGSSAEELSAVTHQTSGNLLEQQSQTEQVAAAMNEMASTVQEVASNISNTALAAQTAHTETQQGQTNVEQAIVAIQQLARRIEGAATTISKVESDSKEISSVMSVIKSIAEQTNLLALNAAIEAARAGEQGRGFAVVADEVRALASRTQDSTEEINQVIEKLQFGSREAVEVMGKSQEEAQNAVDKATKAGQSLSIITSSVDRINDMSIQIASAAEQQIYTSDEINRNIITISEMSQDTTNGAEQTALATEELSRLASDLQDLSRQFKV